MRSAAIFCGLALLAGCGGPPAAAAPILELHVRGGSDGARCVTEAGGRRIADAALPALARDWRGREARMIFDVNVPYRCVGGVIYELQRAGVRIGFAAEPPPAPR